MNERLWSPQMRKWAKDAHLHGIPIGFARTGRPHDNGGEWGGGTLSKNVLGTGVSFPNIKVDGQLILNFGRGIFRIS